MKYKKGTFTLVPNINYLKGKSPFLQTLFMWICQHTDENGICYPSRERLAQECGCEIRSIDRHMKVLEEDGVIVKTKRKKAKTKENASNVYQVILVDKYNNKLDLKSLPSDSFIAEEQDSNVVYPSDLNATVTISSITKSNIPAKAGETNVSEIPFIFQDELKKLKNSTWKPHKIIALFFIRKGWTFENKKQFDTNVSRYLRDARSLEGYTGQQISDTMDFCEDKYKDVDWKLSTVIKSIASVTKK